MVRCAHCGVYVPPGTRSAGASTSTARRSAVTLAPANADWLEGAKRLPSPHADRRPEGAMVDLRHPPSLPAGAFEGDAVERLLSGTLSPEPPFEPQGACVSAHLFVRRDGEVIQFVPFSMRAWHAGLSNFRGRNACNDFSVGIEMEGGRKTPFSEAQYEALSRILPELVRKHPIRWVTGHEVIAPGRKTDPGPTFDWGRVGAMLPAGWSSPLRPRTATSGCLKPALRISPAKPAETSAGAACAIAPGILPTQPSPNRRHHALLHPSVRDRHPSRRSSACSFRFAPGCGAGPFRPRHPLVDLARRATDWLVVPLSRVVPAKGNWDCRRSWGPDPGVRDHA